MSKTVKAMLKKNYDLNKISEINDFSIEEVQKLKDEIDAKKKSTSYYVKTRALKLDVREQSNGESALMYFVNEIKENSLYLLDEPENSMSAAVQIKLTEFLEESARFFHCQLSS